MIFPSIEQLTKNKHNRYALVIATAKAARLITDDLIEKREEMEKTAGIKEPSASDKIAQAQKEFKDFPEEKPVKSAIQKIYKGEYVIIEE